MILHATHSSSGVPNARRGSVDPRLLREPAVRRALTASVVCGLVSAAAVVVQAVALARLLASAMGSTAVTPLPTILGIAGSALVRAMCAALAEVMGARGAEAAKSSLRAKLLAATVSRAGGGRATAGEIAAVAGRGIESLDPFIRRCVPDLVLAAAVPAGLLVVIGAIDWLSAVILAAVLGLFPVFGMLVGASSNDLARRRWSQVEAFGRQIADVFEGLPLLRALGHSARQRERVRQAGAALEAASLSTLRVAFLSALVLDTLASVSVALVAVPLGVRLLTGSVSLSVALAVLIVAPEVLIPLRRATAEFHESTEGLAAAHSALSITDDADGGAAVLPGCLMPDPRNVPVALRHVRVERARRAHPVLDDMSLTLRPGEHVVLMGPNGAGKSTIIELLLGFLEPSKGAVRIGDRDLRAADLDAWRRRLAYLPEHPTLLAASLADNLRLGSPGASPEDLARVLDSVNASHLLASLPQGLGTALGDGGRAVSMGERQRVAVARLLLRDASLYLLDEPTAHLDASTEGRVIDALEQRLRGRSAVIVTHSYEVLRLADRVLTLYDGRLKPACDAIPARPAAPLAVPA